MANKPVDNYNIKGIKAAVWQHESGEKTFRNLTLKKSYKDDKGEFKETESFNVTDIPQLVVALNEIYKKEMLGEYA